MSEEADFDYDVKVIPIDEKMMGQVTEMVNAGWQIMQGVKPLAIYHVVRAKPKPQVPVLGGGALGRIVVDESKVHILRANGNLEDQHGNVVGRKEDK